LKNVVGIVCRQDSAALPAISIDSRVHLRHLSSSTTSAPGRTFSPGRFWRQGASKSRS